MDPATDRPVTTGPALTGPRPGPDRGHLLPPPHTHDHTDNIEETRPTPVEGYCAVFRCPTCLEFLTDPTVRRCPACNQRLRGRSSPVMLGRSTRLADFGPGPAPPGHLPPPHLEDTILVPARRSRRGGLRRLGSTIATGVSSAARAFARPFAAAGRGLRSRRGETSRDEAAVVDATESAARDVAPAETGAAPEPELHLQAAAPEPEPEPAPVAHAPEPEPEPEPAAHAPEPEPEPQPEPAVARAPAPEPRPRPTAPEPEPVAVRPYVPTTLLARARDRSRAGLATTEPTPSGAPWWTYRRPAAVGSEHQAEHDDDEPAAMRPGDGHELAPHNGNGEPPQSGGSARGPDDRGPVVHPPPRRAGLLPAALALLVAGVLLWSARNAHTPTLGRYLIPLFGVLAALACGSFLKRRHPDEPWLAHLLLLGVVAKLVGAFVRYQTLIDSFGGVGDATEYHKFGTLYALGRAPELPDLRRTNFIRWFTGEVYTWLGIDIVTGFLAYSMIAVVGSYFWYRATVDGVPFVHRRLYCALVFLAPSVMFWPSSIGKEALMNLGLGLGALGVVLVFRHRLLPGFAAAAAGGWLLWVVRPHLLALATVAAGAAYFVGRKPGRVDASLRDSLARPVAMVVIVFVAVFTINQAADFLGMEDLSLKSIEAELAEQNERSTQGGSKIEGSDTHITPLSFPRGLVTLLLRPFPWEVETGFQILASLENVALAGLVLARHRSLRLSLTRARSTPFLLFCWILVLVYAVAFSSFGNFGLLVRQRSLVLPAVYVLLALDPRRATVIPRATTLPDTDGHVVHAGA